MDYPIVDALIGLLLGAAAIGIPQLVRKRRQRGGDDDTEAYLKETGRSAQDIAQSNAVLEAQQMNDARSKKADDLDGPASGAHAGSH